MKIQTQRLELTEISWADLENIHRLHSIFEVDEFNTVGIPKSIEETRENVKPYVEANQCSPQSKYTWNIKLKETDEFIGLGGIKLSLDKFRIGEIFYKLLPEYWGNGYATEVSKQLIETGFERFNLHRIEAGCAVKNYQSIRVLEKSGMAREGIQRKILPIRGEWVDSYMYSIIEDERSINHQQNH
ncbi:MAG: GNAT family N-acetyltransferase [Salinivirgaceae bacterium]|jgi:RimJ/RimL family protein N-acetyltransferase